MSEITIRDARPADFARILRLNEIEVQYTSSMDADRLRHLDLLSAYHRVAVVDGQIAAFLFAMRDGAHYVNDNFDWFSRRLGNFLYIDRVVVAPEFTGKKIGSAMYGNLFEFAQARGIEHVVCEYNVEPPNLASEAFHRKWGFTEMGSQWLNNGAKRVSLQAVNLAAQPDS